MSHTEYTITDSDGDKVTVTDAGDEVWVACTSRDDGTSQSVYLTRLQAAQLRDHLIAMGVG